MKVLDLFCGAGGASMGLHQAGFEVTGIDINKQPKYPFTFIQKDCKELKPEDLQGFDLIWASPKCQAYSIGTKGWRNAGKEYENQIPWVKSLLRASKKPYIIENVPNAPIKKDLLLCGTMFDLNVFRHRIFEINGFRIEQPRHPYHLGTVSDGKKFSIMNGGVLGCFGNKQKREKIRGYYTCAGHGGNGSSMLCLWRNAMKIDWMNKYELTQAIPPAYSNYIGKAAIEQLSDMRLPHKDQRMLFESEPHVIAGNPASPVLPSSDRRDR